VASIFPTRFACQICLVESKHHLASSAAGRFAKNIRQGWSGARFSGVDHGAASSKYLMRGG
jgi:hypothetical protein